MHYDPSGDLLRNNDQMTCKCQKPGSDKRDNITAACQALKNFKLNTAELRKDILPTTQANRTQRTLQVIKMF